MFAGVLLALAAALPASASQIPLGVWQEFAFERAGRPATGCRPVDPDADACFPSLGTPSEFLGPAPWTFTAPSDGAILTVADTFLAGDRFEVFDFGVSIGLTSQPFGNNICGDDPVPCLTAEGVSHGTFLLPEGDHSLSITPVVSFGGSAFFRVDAAGDSAPEPSTCLLLMLGMVGLLARPLRRAQARPQ